MQPTAQHTELRTIVIPTEICNHVIEHGLWRPMQIMLMLKGLPKDKLKTWDIDLQGIADTLGITTKTVRNNLKKLIGINWIGYNKLSKTYHVRSFWKIMQMYDNTSRDCAQFDFRSILDVKAHVVAQSMGKLLNYQKKKLRTERRKSVERKTSIRSNQADLQHTGYFPLSNKALATCWEKSTSHAHRMKKLAKDAGFIKVNKGERNDSLSLWFYGMCRLGRKSEASRIMSYNNEVIMKPDLVQHTLHFKTHRKRFEKHK